MAPWRKKGKTSPEPVGKKIKERKGKQLAIGGKIGYCNCRSKKDWGKKRLLILGKKRAEKANFQGMSSHCDAGAIRRFKTKPGPPVQTRVPVGKSKIESP